MKTAAAHPQLYWQGNTPELDIKGKTVKMAQTAQGSAQVNVGRSHFGP